MADGHAGRARQGGRAKERRSAMTEGVEGKDWGAGGSSKTRHGGGCELLRTGKERTAWWWCWRNTAPASGSSLGRGWRTEIPVALPGGRVLHGGSMRAGSMLGDGRVHGRRPAGGRRRGAMDEAEVRATGIGCRPWRRWIDQTREREVGVSSSEMGIGPAAAEGNKEGLARFTGA